MIQRKEQQIFPYKALADLLVKTGSLFSVMQKLIS